MFSRFHPAFVAFAGSILLLAGLIAALYWDPFASEDAGSSEPLLVYCAEALRVPMEAREHGNSSLRPSGPRSSRNAPSVSWPTCRSP